MKARYDECPKCHGVLENDGSCSCGYGVKRRGPKASTDKIDRTCPWNDHGNICGLVGSLSDATNGQGPWYCSKHFWKLKGFPERAGSGEHVTVRDQFFKDRQQPYEPPNLDGTAHLKPMADKDGDLMRRLHSGLLGKRAREPGDDDDFIQA